MNKLKPKPESIAFFETPNFIVNHMIKLSNLKEEDVVLEGGFGKGAFLKELININIKALYGVEYSYDFYKEVKNTYTKIIGNPPYIESDDLDKNVKDNIRRITQSGESNIYYAFIMKSIELLKEKGELIYILPIDFLYNTHGKKLRDYMYKNGYFETIINLKEINIFKAASPEVIIFKYIKTSKVKNKKIEILELKNNINKKKLEEDWFNSFNSYSIELFHSNDDLWNINEKDKIEGVYLKDIEDIKISVGTVNGSEKNFIIKDSIKINTKEKKYIKKFVKNKNRNNLVKVEDYIFIPIGEFKNEEEFKIKAPNIYNYISKNKQELMERKITKSKNWWDYTAIRNIKVFEENKNKYKINVPNITRIQEKWFFLTKNDYYVGGDLLIITSNNQKKLLKIFEYLNSKEFIDYYKEQSIKKGNRYIFTHKILENIKIPLRYIN